MGRKLTAVSLFCGCGGTDVGLKGGFDFLGKHYKDNNIEISFANDTKEGSRALFAENLGIEPDGRDIKNIDSSEIPPDIDILTGGFPCQSFSVIAQNPKRLGIKDERGMLFFEMCRIIKETRPKCFIAENVKGILSANDHEAFPLILQEFEKCGYNVSYRLLNASEYGVPQKRERVFMIGFRDDLGLSFDFDRIKTEEKTIPLSRVVDKEVDSRYFFSERAVKGMLKNKKKMNKGRAQPLDEPCNTVGAHLAKVSLNSTDPVLMDNGKYRRFTPREVARIQSFPETYRLVGSESSQYWALGNAIPPVMMWKIATEVCRMLRSI